MRATLLFVILLQTWISTVQLCPQHCSCKPVGAQAEWLRLKCGDSLQEINDVDINAVSVELIQLDLSKNAIYVIQADAFVNLTNLRRLDLSKNKINSIGENCFNGLENLERLDLSQNQISTIDSYAFKKLSNLKKLDLSGNKITALAPSLFHNLLALDRFPPPKCASPILAKGQPVKKLRFSEELQCQWISPAIEIRPVQNQVVFAGDSITLKCRAPSITVDQSARLNWLWYPNASAEIVDLSAYKDPRKSLSNIKIDNRYLSDSGIVDSALSIVPVKEEHNGQWNCLLVSVNGNKSKAVSVIVISEHTRYCPLAVTRNNKGVYTWPKTIVGWKAELPCEGSRLLQAPLTASYHCNMSGQWEQLNTESCPYVSHTTKILEQFSRVNLSLARSTLLETVKRFKNYTGNGSVKLTDPVEIHFIVRTIENYLSFLIDEKELGVMLIDIVGSMMKLSKEMLKRAEISFKACTRLIKAIERITEFTPSIQSHTKHIALEEFRVKRDSFGGLTCTWYTSIVANTDSDARFFHCTTINRTTPINTKDKTIEASIQLPASLLQRSQDSAIAQQLMISMYSDSRLFPKTISNDSMDISTCIVGSKLIGASIRNLSEPVYVMLKAPLYHYNGRRPRPVVWDETLNNTGAWTSDGCRLTNLVNNLIVFHCDRLGYYGLLQEVSHLDINGNSMHGAKFRYSHPAIYIGSFVTITCLMIMSVTYIISYTSITMPKKAKHSVINTWFAMALLSFLYSIGIQQTEHIEICQGVGLTLHYLSLCCLFWMAVSASNMYKKLAKSGLDVIPDDDVDPDQPIPKPLLGLYLVGWGVALIICGISGAINLREYAGYSRCFLTSGPALAALFIPSGILIAYLLIFLLLIRRAIQNVDVNAQLSEGTQATENMDLELLEPNPNPSGDRNSVRSAQTVSSDIEDPEHSQFTQWKGQIVMLVLYLISWAGAAAVTVKPFNSMPFEETIFAVIYAISASSLGMFVLFFYGIARNDVRSQWLKMRCWLEKRKNRCCRTRSVCDANAAIPTQPLVQNFVPPLSNAQATQAISDTNSVASSRNTNQSQQIYNCSKLADLVAASRDSVPTVPVSAKAANLIVLHRQQYRSNNSVTTYTEPTSACVEMFYNPHQSGVARKFFKKQRRHSAKKNNLGPRKQGDGGATSDGGSCVSVPRPTAKINNSLERSILSSSAKVNNTNIHVELNPINDIKNVNILSDSGGSISEERNIPIRFVIGQENLLRSVKKINNGSARQDNSVMIDTSQPKRTAHADSDADVSKTDEEWHLRNVSQQCSLEYSSEMDTVTQMTSERSDHNLPEICESAEECFSKRCSSDMNEIEVAAEERLFLRGDTAGRLYLSNSMYCLPLEHERPLTNSYCNSLNDIVSLKQTHREYSNRSLTDVQNTISSNLCGQEVPESRRSFDRSERSLFEINSLASDNPCTLTPHTETPYACSLANIHCISDKSLEENDFREESQTSDNVVDNNVFNVPESKDFLLEKNFDSLADIPSISKSSSHDINNFGLIDETSACLEPRRSCDIQQFEANEIYLHEPVSHLPVKKETSV
ncbi:putative g-protein coupled receptor 125-like protein [Lasius niger]|uniref:Putative g-protein coupled receptor 125-like protein n=1 Tax=Lasius niger TaxID=67767 RepID=A0A0J7NWB4_LASNI|nr:putative g-protein coupled receptor 125-like protein [Lasius niger]